MTEEIKAIETEYAGHRFRSRLEARWAMLLDKLGIKWEYEPEAFVVGEGTGYAPDFWLPAQRAFLEIKPDMESLSTEQGSSATFRAYMLEQMTGFPVYLAFGLRDVTFMHMVRDPGGKVDTDAVWLERCGDCQAWWFTWEGTPEHPCGHTSAWGWGQWLDEEVTKAAAHRFWEPGQAKRGRPKK